MQLLNGMLFFVTVLLPALGFYLGWVDEGEGGVTLLGVSLLVPCLLLAPRVVGTHSIRDPRDAAPSRAIP
jgi:hypothetical protein